jgi:hypothetical protein
VALLLERNPKLTPADIRRILQSSARRLGPGERDDSFALASSTRLKCCSSPIRAPRPRHLQPNDKAAIALGNCRLGHRRGHLGLAGVVTFLVAHLTRPGPAQQRQSCHGNCRLGHVRLGRCGLPSWWWSRSVTVAPDRSFCDVCLSLDSRGDVSSFFWRSRSTSPRRSPSWWSPSGTTLMRRTPA